MKATLTPFIAAACLFAARSDAQTGPPRGLAVEFENESVTVLRVRLRPHEKTPMHEVTPRVVVWLTDAHLKDTSADGTTREEHWKAGQVIWVSAQRHAGENLRAQTVEFHRSGPQDPAGALDRRR